MGQEKRKIWGLGKNQEKKKKKRKRKEEGEKEARARNIKRQEWKLPRLHSIPNKQQQFPHGQEERQCSIMQWSTGTRHE